MKLDLTESAFPEFIPRLQLLSYLFFQEQAGSFVLIEPRASIIVPTIVSLAE